MKNHLGSYECKLCLTLHNNEVILDLYLFTLISLKYQSRVVILYNIVYYREVIWLILKEKSINKICKFVCRV